MPYMGADGLYNERGYSRAQAEVPNGKAIGVPRNNKMQRATARHWCMYSRERHPSEWCMGILPIPLLGSIVLGQLLIGIKALVRACQVRKPVSRTVLACSSTLDPIQAPFTTVPDIYFEASAQLDLLKGSKTLSCHVQRASRLSPP